MCQLLLSYDYYDFYFFIEYSLKIKDLGHNDKIKKKSLA